MPGIDTNELFPWLRVCQDPALIDETQALLGERLNALQTSKLASGAAQQQEPHVQPSYETSSGGARAMPLTGPGPAPNLGQDVFRLAEWNERREEAQKASLRGPGPDPERVEVGMVPQEKAEQAQQIADETSQAVVEKTREAAGGQAPQAGSEQPGGGTPQPPQGAQQQQQAQQKAEGARKPEEVGQALSQHIQADKAELAGIKAQQGQQQPQGASPAPTPHEQAVEARAARGEFPAGPKAGGNPPEQIASQVRQQQSGKPQGKQARMAQRPAPKT